MGLTYGRVLAEEKLLIEEIIEVESYMEFEKLTSIKSYGLSIFHTYIIVGLHTI